MWTTLLYFSAVPHAHPSTSPAPPRVNPACSSDLEPLLRQFEHERAQASAAAAQAAQWDRFLRCVHTPHPRERVAVAAFLARMVEPPASGDAEDLTAAFVGCEVRAWLRRDACKNWSWSRKS